MEDVCLVGGNGTGWTRCFWRRMLASFLAKRRFVLLLACSSLVLIAFLWRVFSAGVPLVDISCSLLAAGMSLDAPHAFCCRGSLGACSPGDQPRLALAHVFSTILVLVFSRADSMLLLASLPALLGGRQSGLSVACTWLHLSDAPQVLPFILRTVPRAVARMSVNACADSMPQLPPAWRPSHGG